MFPGWSFCTAPECYRYEIQIRLITFFHAYREKTHDIFRQS